MLRWSSQRRVPRKFDGQFPPALPPSESPRKVIHSRTSLFAWTRKEEAGGIIAWPLASSLESPGRSAARGPAQAASHILEQQQQQKFVRRCGEERSRRTIRKKVCPISTSAHTNCTRNSTVPYMYVLAVRRKERLGRREGGRRRKRRGKAFKATFRPRPIVRCALGAPGGQKLHPGPFSSRGKSLLD